jgi:hypothetical protein
MLASKKGTALAGNALPLYDFCGPHAPAIRSLFSIVCPDRDRA